MKLLTIVGRFSREVPFGTFRAFARVIALFVRGRRFAGDQALGCGSLGRDFAPILARATALFVGCREFVRGT
jgi:hypothetical protein